MAGAIRKGGSCDGRLLEKCINIKVEIAALELLMEPEEAEDCLRYVLKQAKRRGSGILEIFDTEEEKEPFCGKQEALVGAPKRVALQESGHFKYEGIMAKVPPCSGRSMKTPLPQQSSSSVREEESQWISVEDRDEMATTMLGYLEDSEDLKVDIHELNAQLKTLEEEGRSIVQIAKKARNEKGQKIFDTFRQGKEEVCTASFARWNTLLKSPAELERRCRGMTQEVKLLSERQEVLKGMVEDKIRLRTRATEKYYEQIFEEMKELEQTEVKGSVLTCTEKAQFDAISK